MITEIAVKLEINGNYCEIFKQWNYVMKLKSSL